MRFPNSSLIFYSKTKDDIKKFITDYLKFINTYSHKEAKAYPDIIYLNIAGPKGIYKTSF